MMDWQKKMLDGMRLLREACRENKEWDKCQKCPFDEYCTALMNEKLVDPFEGLDWELLSE